MIVGKRREELERVKGGGFQLEEEERTERVSLIKYRLLKYIIAWISLGHHFCQLDEMVGNFQKAFFLFFIFYFFFSMNLKGF